MKLTPVIEALRQRCPLFEQRVSGVVQFATLPAEEKLTPPAAYLAPGEDIASDQRSQTDYWQTLAESFSVTVVLPAGEGLLDQLHDARQSLWQALLGWQPDPQAQEIVYHGSTLLPSSEGELCCQFAFTRRYEIDTADTWQENQLNQLGPLESLQVDVDFIAPGHPPDGVIEHHTEIHFRE